MMGDNNSYKLTYFDLRGIGEPIRWIFHYAGVPYEDHRIPWDYVTWFEHLKKEFTSTVGQVPVLTINGKQKLCQSSAISRFLADEFGLLGDSSFDRARGDEAISMIFDLFDFWRRNVFERDLERKVTVKEQVDQQFSLYYGKLNQLLEEVDGDFLNGDKLTHADFWIANFIDIWNNPLTGKPPVLPPGVQPLTDEAVVYVNLVDQFPALKKHQEKILSIPQIKKWVAERPKVYC